MRCMTMQKQERVQFGMGFRAFGTILMHTTTLDFDYQIISFEL